MLIDGIDLLEGSIVENLTIDSGDATAQGNLSPSNGKLLQVWETVELQAVHIDQLKQEIEQLKQKIG